MTNVSEIVLLMIAAITLWCGIGTIGMLKGYARYPEDNL